MPRILVQALDPAPVCPGCPARLDFAAYDTVPAFAPSVPRAAAERQAMVALGCLVVGTLTPRCVGSPPARRMARIMPANRKGATEDGSPAAQPVDALVACVRMRGEGLRPSVLAATFWTSADFGIDWRRSRAYPSVPRSRADAARGLQAARRRGLDTGRCRPAPALDRNGARAINLATSEGAQGLRSRIWI